jgi:hypothetical protein rflaF_01904
MFAQIILQIIFIALYAAFTCTETAVISINDNLLEKLAASGGKKAIRLKKVIESPAGFLTSVHTAISLIGFLGSAFAAINFSGRLSAAFGNLFSGIPGKVIFYISAVIIIVAVLFFTIVLGELVPKRLALKNPEKIALKMSGFILAASKFFMPLVWLTNAVSGGILKVLGVDPEENKDAVTEEEILMMSDAGAEKGTIDEDENRIIKNVFAFDDLTAGQVCTHRTDVSVLWTEESVEVWEETIHRTRHSDFPICGENVDDVIGILDAKDYFRLDDKSRENIMKNAVREPCFVHENMKADRLFEQMKQSGSDHFAVVVDEYGGMSGIITITDLVEELVGDFADDDDLETSVKLEQISENVWNIPGITSLSEVCSELEITLPADKYDTFSGYVIAELGEIPKNGTQVNLDADNLHIEVIEVNHHRIEMCRVQKLDLKAAESEKNSDE